MLCFEEGLVGMIPARDLGNKASAFHEVFHLDTSKWAKSFVFSGCKKGCCEKGVEFLLLLPACPHRPMLGMLDIESSKLLCVEDNRLPVRLQQLHDSCRACNSAL